MGKELDKITARQLRQLLYYAADPAMTVRELREVLFDIKDQDAEYDVGFSLYINLMIASGRVEESGSRGRDDA